ncbi:MAG: HAMP domain-containing protein [Spirochaetales bacterium]|nr:HAMP domain-containing protein [Spirochaetales bacterium]
MIIRILSFLSRISVRLLGFNLLLVFLPIAGFLYFDIYERQLLKMQENSMVQQGRLMAAALSGREYLEKKEAVHILTQLKRRQGARIRIVDTRGLLIADSSQIMHRTETEVLENQEENLAYGTREAVSGPDDSEEPEILDNWLYRIASFPIRIYRQIFVPPEQELESEEFYFNARHLTGKEIMDALQGRYGATTRISSGGQRSVTLYCAIPVRNGSTVTGAVLASQSTYRILNNIYEVRLEIFKIFLVSVFAAVILSLIMATTIARPLKQLKYQAEAMLDRRGRLKQHFKPYKRKDEIGNLSHSLSELTKQLDKHITFIESFTTDLCHEFKNPLTSIRSATEMIMDLKDPEEQNRFLKIILSDVSRMETLLSEVREITHIDTQIDNEKREWTNINRIIMQIVEGYRLKENGKNITYNVSLPEQEICAEISPERLTQVLENLIDNAESFSPESRAVTVSLETDGLDICFSVSDSGPGIPEEIKEDIFKRFFSYRSGQDGKRLHTGLGLAIVKSIVEAYNGNISATNNPEGGARFTVSLPASITQQSSGDCSSKN